MLKLIVCLDKNNGISKNGKLAWNVKEEMEHFRKTTLNSIVVMGRKTYESIGRLLPNRKNIILTNNKKLKIEGATIMNDYNEILKLSENNDVFIIGGKEIYNLFLNYCDELIISRLKKDYECDLKWEFNDKFFQLDKTIKNKEFSIYYYSSLRHKVIDGKLISENIIKKLVLKNKALIKKYKDIPKLVIIYIGNDYGSSVYVKNKQKLGQRIGINVEIISKPKISQNELLSLINKLNKDKSVNGILVQHPLPKNIDEELISNAINQNKDIDCFHPENLGKVFKNVQPKYIKSIPCTPWGIIEMLKYSNVELTSKNVVILGRSNIVGKPLVPLFLKENCTVQICHSKTKDLINITKKADILVSAIGKANFVNSKFIKEGSIIIDVGINRLDNKLCGDVDFKDCIKKASLISPVPNGVGPMTLAMLFANLINLYIIQKQEKI